MNLGQRPLTTLAPPPSYPPAFHLDDPSFPSAPWHPRHRQAARQLRLSQNLSPNSLKRIGKLGVKGRCKRTRDRRPSFLVCRVLRVPVRLAASHSCWMTRRMITDGFCALGDSQANPISLPSSLHFSPRRTLLSAPPPSRSMIFTFRIRASSPSHKQIPATSSSLVEDRRERTTSLSDSSVCES